MRLPELYHGLKLPHKLPPKKDALSVNGLPMLGYMEQTVSIAITKALTAVGCFKPKYPFLDAKRSALLYVAYHLKGSYTMKPFPRADPGKNLGGGDLAKFCKTPVGEGSGGYDWKSEKKLWAQRG